MMQYLLYTTYVILGCYLLGLILSGLTSRRPDGTIDISSATERLRTERGQWWFMMPIVGLFILLHNVGVVVFWFIKELLALVVKLLTWIWSEVFVAGGYLLFRLFWHYLILWPWRLFLLGINAIRPSLNLKYFRLGVTWLFISFLIAFLGKYLSYLSEMDFWGNFFGIISIIPIGIGLSKIIASKVGVEDETALSRRYARNLLIFVGIFFAIICIEFVVMFLASFTNLSFIFSTLISGGTIASSLFLILNSFLLLFGLSALPSFSARFEGTDRDMVKGYFRYLIYRWPAYILALPVTLIPGIILCIVPYLLTQGASRITADVSDKAFESRISTLEARIGGSEPSRYVDWLDTQKVSDEQLVALQQADHAYRMDLIRLSVLNRNQEYMKSFYMIHASDIATMPVTGLIYLTNLLSSTNRDLIETSPMERTDVSIPENAGSFQKDLDGRRIPDLAAAIENASKQIVDLNKKLAMVCVTDSVIVRNTQPEQRQQPQQSQPEMSFCDRQREMYKRMIKETEESKQNFLKSKSRAEAVSTYMATALGEHDSANGTLKFSEASGYLFASIWFCLLIALSFGLLIPLIALVNDGVHNIFDGDQRIYVTQQFQQATRTNPNQPYLGIAVFIPAAYFLIPMLLSVMYPEKFNEDQSVLDMIRSATIGNLEGMVGDLDEASDNLQEDEGIGQSSTDSMAADTTDAGVLDSTAVAIDTAVMAMPDANIHTGPVYLIDELDTQPELTVGFEYDTRIHIRNGAPEGSTYTVGVSFIINEDGSVEGINCSTAHGYGMEDEVIEKIQGTSGNWKPGEKEGAAVRTRYFTEFKFGN